MVNGKNKVERIGDGDASPMSLTVGREVRVKGKEHCVWLLVASVSRLYV